MPVSLETDITKLLGCKYPVVQTAMGWVADPNLVAGTCNAGGFGFLAGATIPPEEMERDILKVKELTAAPFGVNFHMYQPNAAHIVDLVVEHGVRAVSYSRSPGPEFVKKLKDAGVVCMPTIGLPKHATKAIDMGADAVTVQGGEGGGAEPPFLVGEVRRDDVEVGSDRVHIGATHGHQGMALFPHRSFGIFKWLEDLWQEVFLDHLRSDV